MTVRNLACDGFLVHRSRYRVVDIQQGNSRTRYADTDVLAQCAVDINLARNRNTTAGQTEIDVARHEAKLGLECRPALVCKCCVLAGVQMLSHPVLEGQLVLCQTGQDAGKLALAVASLGSHLGVLFDCYAQIVQCLNGCVAGQEVVRTRAESEDFETLGPIRAVAIGANSRICCAASSAVAHG